MTAYIVAKRFGVDTSEHTKICIRLTESMSKIEDIEQSIKTVSMYSSRIINDIEKQIDPVKLKNSTNKIQNIMLILKESSIKQMDKIDINKRKQGYVSKMYQKMKLKRLVKLI